MKLATKLPVIITLIILMLSLFPLTLNAQGGEQLKFENLTREDGVSGSEVRNVIQDEHGRIWFGTRFNGVNVYDGYDIEVYNHDPNNPQSLAGDPAFSVFKDNQGTIWVSTLGAGLSKFNPETETFTTYWHDPDDPTSIWDDSVQLTFEDRDGNFWVAAANGLDKMDRETGTFTHFSFDPNDPVAPSNQNIKVFYQDREGGLWLGLRRGGLRRIDPDTGQVLEAYVHNPDDPTSISDDNVFAIVEDHTGTFWVGSWQGLNILDRETGTFTHIPAEPDNPRGLSDRRIFSMLEDSNNTLWVGTGVGLNKYNRDTGEFSRYLNDPNDPNSLVHNEVLHLYEDTSGILWISTLAGLSKLDLSPPKFTSYRATSATDSLNSNDVEAILEDSQGALWFAAEETLNKWDPQTNTFTHYQADTNSPEPLGYIDDIFEDPQGVFWLGTQNGLYEFDRETGSFNRYEENPDYPLGEEIRQIAQDQSGYLWLNVQGVGLKRVDPETGVIINHYYHNPNDPDSISDDYINHFYLTPDDVLWIGSEGGLNKLDINTETVTRYSFDPEGKEGRDPSNDIQHIYASPSGTMWVSTISGLNAFNPETGEFITYTTEDGLPSNLVQWTSEDEQGNLWVGTANGLVKFNPQTNTFRHYDVADGLTGIELSNDMIKSSWGEIFFASVNEGVNAFFPDKIEDNPHIPPVILTDFQLFNRSIRKYGEESVLPKPINELETLTLAHDESVFTLDFAALNYRLSEKNLYQYKLEGFDADWSPVGKKRSATYTNLDPGEYVFKVRGSNNDGIWNEANKSLRIIVLPPWWETWWFRGAVIVAALALVFGGFSWRVQEIRRQNRLLEAQVKERTNALQKSEARFRGLSESTSEGIVIHDNGIVVDVNQAAQDLFGYSRTEFIGKHIKELGTSDSWVIATEHIQTACGEPYEMEGLRRDGSTFPMEIQAKTVPYQDKQVRVAAVQDITQHKEAEKRLLEAKERAEAANRAKSIFLATMSHELRTPLNGILGYAQILKQDLSMPQHQQDLNIIQRSGEHLLQVINDILDLAKVEAGKIEFYPQPFNLPNFILNVCDMMQIRADAKSLFCSKKFGPLPQTVLGDEYRLRQILVNLLGNAIKFTNQGGVTLMVDSDPDGDDLIRFQVTDTGAGIASEDLQTVFEPFKQSGDHTHKRKGTGLGLAISQELVELMGGTLQVKSELNQGSTFWFSIPLPEVAGSSKLVFHTERSITGIKGQSLKILVVDDEADSRKVVVDILGSLGFAMAEAGDGKDGLAQTATFKPNAVILNLAMPQMGGLELIRRIRELPDANHIPLIVSSARSFNEVKEQCLAAGANAFVPKPVDFTLLLDTLQQQLHLEWVYGKDEITTNPEEPLVAPPPNILSELIELASIGDIAYLQQYADKLAEGDPQLAPFVAKVRHYADSFEIIQLQTFLESHGQE